MKSTTFALHTEQNYATIGALDGCKIQKLNECAVCSLICIDIVRNSRQVVNLVIIIPHITIIGRVALLKYERM